MKTRTLWLGLGAAAVTSTLIPDSMQASTSPAALDAAQASARCAVPRIKTQVAENHAHGAAKSKTDAGGEGGEGGEGSAAKADADAALDPAVRFYRDIQLVRGHILVGDELVQAGLWKDALPHFLHPVEELYEKLGPDLKKRGMKPFLAQLKTLAQTVKAKNLGAYTEALTALNGRLDGVDAALKSKTGKWMPFVVDTALETMRTAIGEYGESIEGGKFAKAVEYQDSRGFVFQAERLLTSVSPALDGADAAAALKGREAVTALKAAWPSAVPPATPVMDAATVASAVSKVELALGSLK
jgi:hypothetical protein